MVKNTRYVAAHIECDKVENTATGCFKIEASRNVGKCGNSVHTHSVWLAHFSDTVSLRDVQTSRTRMFCSAHVISLHLTLSILMFHPPSLLFPHGHFETTFPPAQSLPDFTRPKSAGQAHFRTSAEEFGYLADSTHSTGYEPTEFDKTSRPRSLINDPDHRISDFSKITRENTEQFGVSAVFESSVLHVSHR